MSRVLMAGKLARKTAFYHSRSAPAVEQKVSENTDTGRKPLFSPARSQRDFLSSRLHQGPARGVAGPAEHRRLHDPADPGRHPQAAPAARVVAAYLPARAGVDRRMLDWRKQRHHRPGAADSLGYRIAGEPRP